MLWNRRRSYYGIFVEQLLVAIILMLSVVSLSEAVKKYTTPGMLHVKNTVFMGYMFDRAHQPEGNSEQSMKTIAENMKKLPFVESVSASFNFIPYLRNDWIYEYYLSDSVHIDDKHFTTIIKETDEFAANVFKIRMEEGVWFENRALPDGSAPAVITRQFADKAGWTSCIGKKVTLNARTYTITGVAEGLKQEPLIPSPVAIVVPQYLAIGHNDHGGYEYAARIKPGYQKDFFKAFEKEFKRVFSSKEIEPLIHDMQAMKDTWMSFSILDIALQCIPTLLLFIFAFLGTFGLSWMLSRKRLKEFALRMALGSTKSRLMAIVIGESLLITCIAVIPALLLSFFIYEYAAVHVVGVGATVGVMLLFSAVSAWYPAWKVSRVNPAEALQYE
ncbi:MAG: ABC transporter permease [Prevotellaceae bacterium]|nr:ABC transporter permease [Prevotellaceae bacterium]